MSNSDWALHDIGKHSNLLTSTRTQNLCIHPTEIKDEQLLYSCLVWIQGSKTNNTSYIRGQSKVNVVVNICKLTLTQCLGYSSTFLMKLNLFPGISLSTIYHYLSVIPSHQRSNPLHWQCRCYQYFIFSLLPSDHTYSRSCLHRFSSVLEALNSRFRVLFYTIPVPVECATWQ